MEWYEAEVRALEARYPGDGDNRPVVFYGSSSIRMWEKLREDFPGVDLVNLGFGGSTLAACVWFFERLVVPQRPRSLVFYAGDNDLGDGCSADDVLASYHRLMEEVTRQLGPIPFAFLAIKPSPARLYLVDAIRRVNEAIRRDLEARPHGYYVDVHAAMLDEHGAPRRELFAEDGLHLSPAGYRVWRAEVSRFASQLF